MGVAGVEFFITDNKKTSLAEIYRGYLTFSV